MNEQLILEQYQQITVFLEKSRLNEALAHIEALLQNCNNWELSNRLEQVQTTYQYMLQYMRQGVKDPDRSKVYKKLSAEAWEIADQVRIKLLDEVICYRLRGKLRRECKYKSFTRHGVLFFQILISHLFNPVVFGNIATGTVRRNRPEATSSFSIRAISFATFMLDSGAVLIFLPLSTSSPEKSVL